MSSKVLIDEILQSVIADVAGKNAWHVPTDLDITTEFPSDSRHGDLSTNIPFALAKVARQAPLKVAQSIAEELSLLPDEKKFFESVHVAPPGFLNFVVSRKWLERDLREALGNPETFGRSKAMADQKVMVEFVSANPTGPLHVGHARGAIAGDTLANLLESQGADVTREYYYNDGGLQMETLGRSARARYLEKLGKPFEFPEDGYRGEYMKDIAARMVEQYGDSLADSDDIRVFTEFAANDILKTIDKDLKDLGIRFDVWTNESDFFREKKVEQAVERLKAAEMAYESEGAVWLRSSADGDQRDRVLVRSNGAPTYITPDIAYHINKFERGFTRVINVLGGDHHGHVPGLKAALKALGFPVERLDFALIQMVSLKKGEERIKLSTRAGDFLPLYEMIAEIGSDVTRYFFLMRSLDAQMTFDWDLAKSTSMENPVYYIQYLHARVCSLVRKAAEVNLTLPLDPDTDLTPLELPEELTLMKAALVYPSILSSAASSLEPHRLTAFLEDLAKSFHSYYTYHRIIDPEKLELTKARLYLVEAVRTIIANALNVLGVSAPTRM